MWVSLGEPDPGAERLRRLKYRDSLGPASMAVWRPMWRRAYARGLLEHSLYEQDAREK